MNNILIMSNIILWIAVVGLGFLVFALTRQIGVLYERVAPAGALMMNQNLEVGMSAPELELRDIRTDNVFRTGQLSANASAQLLFFLSPSCPVCKTLLPVIKSTANAEKKWLDVILASDGPEDSHHAFIAEHKLERFPYVLSESLGKQYGVSKLPYAVLIDAEGKIASLGLINSREHLESLFESMERGVDSIQSYMQGLQSPVNESDLATEIR